MTSKLVNPPVQCNVLNESNDFIMALGGAEMEGMMKYIFQWMFTYPNEPYLHHHHTAPF